MHDLNEFIKMITGHFDNKEQYLEFKNKGISFPYAKHVNTICNAKIKNLPVDFKGFFMVEESYYETDNKLNASMHLFLLEEANEGIYLASYDIPSPFKKDDFKYENISSLDYNSLVLSEKFTKALFKKVENRYEGGSISHFSNVLEFRLKEVFSFDYLSVKEEFYVNNKRTFGYDYPIIYKRIN